MAKSAQDASALINPKPYAGMIESFPSGQVTYLAPIPLPTHMPAQDYGNAVGGVNDTYMDFGLGTPAVFGWQYTVGFPFSFFFFSAVLLPFVVGIFAFGLGNGLSDAIWTFHTFMSHGIETGAWASGFALLVGLVIVFNQLAKYETLVPTRFNRQRREVCFVPAGQTEPIFVPWESLSAWVIQSQSVTQYGATLHYAMGIGFYHPPD
ncbi:hypothetical protein QN406_25270, partial [Pseudomonas sp. MH10out]|nr:hypothetical protein [Pseudomonas sp. MH10out]